MSDDAEVSIRQAAALVGRPVSTVRGWVARRLVPVARWWRREARVRAGDVRAFAAAVETAKGQSRHRRAAAPGPDATAEEVEACVAEQRAALPSWWQRESERVRGLGWRALAGGNV